MSLKPLAPSLARSPVYAPMHSNPLGAPFLGVPRFHRSSTVRRNNRKGPPEGRRSPEARNTPTGSGNRAARPPHAACQRLVKGSSMRCEQRQHGCPPPATDSTRARAPPPLPPENKGQGGGGEGVTLKVSAAPSVPGSDAPAGHGAQAAARGRQARLPPARSPSRPPAPFSNAFALTAPPRSEEARPRLDPPSPSADTHPRAPSPPGGLFPGQSPGLRRSVARPPARPPAAAVPSAARPRAHAPRRGRSAAPASPSPGPGRGLG